MSQLLKGFRFGMILQLAIGPVCLFIFQTSVSSGFLAAESGVLGTVIIDGSEIILAVLGVGIFLKKYRNIQFFLKIFGTAVLFLYGINEILGVFQLSFLPYFNLAEKSSPENIFLYSILLALSNPLTVIFWTGIFSAKIAEENLKKNELSLFGLGCIFATLFFLTFIAVTGSFTSRMLPDYLLKILNFSIGLVMIYFGIRNLNKKYK